MPNKNYAELVPETDDPKLDKMLRFLCRHLVSLWVYYYPIDSSGKPIGQPQSSAYSGFVLSIQDKWYWVTAGHNLEGLEQSLSDKKIKVTYCNLVDYFGSDAISHDPIPFDYEKAPKFYINDKEAGLDFGLVALSLYYQKLLETNNIIPVREENWMHQHEVEFGHYLMLGLPEVFIRPEIQGSENNEQIIIPLPPTFIPITELTEIPDDLPKTQYPRFVAKISDDCPLDNIKGMSGGPIFGFNKESNRYWIVAVQSSRLRSSDLSRDKVIFACPVPVLATLVAEKIIC